MKRDRKENRKERRKKKRLKRWVKKLRSSKVVENNHIISYAGSTAFTYRGHSCEGKGRPVSYFGVGVLTAADKGIGQGFKSIGVNLGGQLSLAVGEVACCVV